MSDPYEHDEPDACVEECPACAGSGRYMGCLGARSHYRCRDCGIEFSDTDREPTEPDGECFRGGEAAAYEAECMASWQRDLK